MKDGVVEGLNGKEERAAYANFPVVLPLFCVYSLHRCGLSEILSEFMSATLPGHPVAHVCVGL
jgi:hypothetical protein